MNKTPRIILMATAVLCAAFILYFFVGNPQKSEQVTWGVNFSQMQTESLGLNWKKTYVAILDDLKIRHIKLHTQWDWVEGKKGEFYFSDIDWQISQAKSRGATLIYVVGMKTGRWPECHLPSWASALSKQDQQHELLEYIKQVVLRYKGEKSIMYWQAENEPLFKFGECPWYDKDFLRKEVALIKSLDPTRKVIVSDSGEVSSWISAARIGDVLGVTLYRKVWMHVSQKYGFYVTYPFTPTSYWRRAELITTLFNKKVIGVELQAEPWTERPFYEVPLSEQEKTMTLHRFQDTIDFARRTGIDEFYLWGAEWWYWMKEKQGHPEFWNEAKKLFAN